MTAEMREATPFYRSIVSHIDEAMAASQLAGLDEELKTMRVYVARFAEAHPDDVEKLIKAMRLIMQMVLAQHRIGRTQMQESIEAMERVVAEVREMVLPPEEDDL